MPTTYTPLATTTLNANAGTVTLSGISGSYTDLVLVMSIIGNAAQEIYFRVNGDTGNNYSGQRLSGNGTTVTGARSSNQNVGFISGIATTSTTNPNFNSITHFQNYSNTTTFKTVLSRANNASVGTEAFVSTWRNTAAITSIEISSSTSSFASGSTFSLYGIASAAVVSGAKATGGDVVATDGTYWYHAFRASGTFTPTQALTCDYLVVAGGGGSGYDYAGGGGAGGFRANTAQSFANGTAYTITVGGGGAGSGSGAGSKGSNSSISGSGFTTFTSTGGGASMYGGSGQIGGTTGGSGGGASAQGTGKAGNEGGYTPVEGYAGGNGGASNGSGGGGGGATAVGNNGSSGTSAVGGTGGAGSSNYSSWGLVTGTGQNISGTVWFAGGGGGASGINTTTQASGGNGGGGTGGAGNNSPVATSGTANTGGGGGGAAPANGSGGSGGSGLIIVRYPV